MPASSSELVRSNIPRRREFFPPGRREICDVSLPLNIYAFARSSAHINRLGDRPVAQPTNDANVALRESTKDTVCTVSLPRERLCCVRVCFVAGLAGVSSPRPSTSVNNNSFWQPVAPGRQFVGAAVILPRASHSDGQAIP